MYFIFSSPLKLFHSPSREAGKVQPGIGCAAVGESARLCVPREQLAGIEQRGDTRE
jgi:hypothetical protein